VRPPATGEKIRLQPLPAMPVLLAGAVLREPVALSRSLWLPPARPAGDGSEALDGDALLPDLEADALDVLGAAAGIPAP
jgi:hypothetical protein